METFQAFPSLKYVDSFDEAQIAQDYDSLIVITTKTDDSKFPGIESYKSFIDVCLLLKL